MKWETGIISFVVFVPLFVEIYGQVGFGPNLKCYQCNSLTQPRCADHFDNRTMILVPCPDDGKNYSRCVKMIQEMYIEGKWTRRYYRDCAVTGVIGMEDGRWCLDRRGIYRVKVRYCNCNNKNGCNGAVTYFIQPIVLGFSQLLVCFLYRLLTPDGY
ncbi:hypothetical protein PHET_09150 [Paragonimus heterotremus]|uniref:Protein quiver n=1 Tax=Paragonimus heterotremus TaxID=100268 RepID=A0A8J4WNS5_9TREM|nr:hypothetical protein PHET_09150 [Paragonimus heterotremus]